MLPPFEFRLTAPLDIVTAPVKVSPSKPLQVRPSSWVVPAKLLAVSPSVSVTLSSKRVDPPPAEETIPEAPPTVLMKRAKPVDAIVIAAPVPSPMPLTAPVNVVVPAPVPAAIVRSREPPANVLLNRMLPPFESRLTAPPDSVTAPVKVRPSKPLQFRPSSWVVPAKLLAVSPSVSVTLLLNRVEPAPFVDTIPELASTVPVN